MKQILWITTVLLLAACATDYSQLKTFYAIEGNCPTKNYYLAGSYKYQDNPQKVNDRVTTKEFVCDHGGQSMGRETHDFEYFKTLQSPASGAEKPETAVFFIPESHSGRYKYLFKTP